jgi:hypothetical protein
MTNENKVEFLESIEKYEIDISKKSGDTSKVVQKAVVCSFYFCQEFVFFLILY